MFNFMEVNALYEQSEQGLEYNPYEYDPSEDHGEEPGKLRYGCDTNLARDWLTAEQAAEWFNLSVREIEERYRPLMVRSYPGSVLDPLTEVRYKYDFEAEDFDWTGYERQQKGLDTVDPYGRSFDCYPEMKKGFVPDEDEDGDALMLMAHSEEGYDDGLEPKSNTTVVSPRLYEKSALMEVRLRRVSSRKDKALPPRGKGGRFVKKAA